MVESDLSIMLSLNKKANFLVELFFLCLHRGLQKTRKLENIYIYYNILMDLKDLAKAVKEKFLMHTFCPHWWSVRTHVL